MRKCASFLLLLLGLWAGVSAQRPNDASPPFTAPDNAGVLKSSKRVDNVVVAGKLRYRNQYDKLGLVSQAVYSGQPLRLDSELFVDRWAITYEYDKFGGTGNPYLPLPLAIKVEPTANSGAQPQQYRLIEAVPGGGLYEDQLKRRFTIRYEYFRL